MPDPPVANRLNASSSQVAGHTRRGRLIVDEPARGSWNMAVDAAILERIQPGDPPTLRFYRWLKPTLSLGYFQASSDRLLHPCSLEIDWVRRSTGGGAIVHDHELTYSVIMPQVEGMHGADHSLYESVHQAVINALQTIGIAAVRAGNSVRAIDQSEPFLCFQRRTDQDLLVNGYKVLGSAQRRGSSGILQHGSLLISSSKAAPELPGLLNLSDQWWRRSRGESDGIATKDLQEVRKAESWDSTRGAAASAEMSRGLIDAITGGLSFAWGVVWLESCLTEFERESAQAIEKKRFTQPLWNFKR